MSKRYVIPAIVVTGALLCIAIIARLGQEQHWFDEEERNYRTWEEIVESDTLRVGTLQSSISAFEYRGRMRGYEYEMAAQVASELGLTLQMVMLTNEQTMLDSLEAGHLDLVAWPTGFRVARNHGGLRSCGNVYEMDFRRISPYPFTPSRRDSARYRLAVVEGTAPWFVLDDSLFRSDFNLRAYRIDTIPSADANPDKIVGRLLSREYDATLVASNMARLLRNYYDTLIFVGNPIQGTRDSMSWVVSEHAELLAAKIDSVCRFEQSAPVYHSTTKRFFMHRNRRNEVHRRLRRREDGSITPYDAIFKQYADSVAWDWHMLAALSFHESGFIADKRSAKGALGIMQIMPETGMRWGCSADSLLDPRCSIRTASRLIRNLEKRLRCRITVAKRNDIEHFAEADSALLVDSTLRADVERDLLWFTLASYNAGLGQVYDAIAMAEELGYDPSVWHHNVEYCLKLKKQRVFYEMPCVRLGQFNAMVTLNYIREVVDAGQYMIDQETTHKTEISYD